MNTEKTWDLKSVDLGTRMTSAASGKVQEQQFLDSFIDMMRLA